MNRKPMTAALFALLTVSLLGTAAQADDLAQAIRSSVRSHQPAIAACYKAALAEQPTLEGKLVVRFVLGAGGETTDVQLENSTLGSVALEACVASLVEDWTFEDAGAPDGTVVSYPFVFKVDMELAQE